MKTCGCIFERAQVKRLTEAIQRIDRTDWANHPSPSTEDWLQAIAGKRRADLVARRAEIVAAHERKHQAPLF